MRVPVGTRLDVQLDRSDLELRGRFDQGSSVRSEAGNVVGRGVSGPVKLTANGGDMDLIDVRGDVNALARAGTMTVDNVGGNVVLTTQSGHLDVKGIHGGVTLNSPDEGRVTYTQPTDPRVQRGLHVNAPNVTVRPAGQRAAGRSGAKRHDKDPRADRSQQRDPQGGR